MSLLRTLKEYTEVIMNGIANGDKIIEALIVSAKAKNEKINAEALAEILRRKEICAECPFNSKHAIASGTYTSSLDFQHCILCKCKIGGEDTKEYCLSCNCGAEVFNTMNPHLPAIQVKWKAFDESTINNIEQ